MKIFQANVSFTEKSEVLITLKAESSDDAVEKIKAELSNQVTDLVIIDVTEVTEVVKNTENVIDLAAARIN